MMRTRLTLVPGQNGAKRLVNQYGERLRCVRYRYDAAKKCRYKTVDLIVEETARKRRLGSRSPRPTR